MQFSHSQRIVGSSGDLIHHQEHTTHIPKKQVV
jgi:hypothetical protein